MTHLVPETTYLDQNSPFPGRDELSCPIYMLYSYSDFRCRRRFWFGTECVNVSAIYITLYLLTLVINIKSYNTPEKNGGIKTTLYDLRTQSHHRTDTMLLLSTALHDVYNTSLAQLNKTLLPVTSVQITAGFRHPGNTQKHTRFFWGGKTHWKNPAKYPHQT